MSAGSDTALPPGPRGAAFGLAAWVARPAGMLERCQARYGDVFTVRLGTFGPHVFVADPDLVRAVLQAPADVLHAGEVNAILAPVVGTRSVLTSDGARHLRQRRLLLPAFHGDRIGVYRERMRMLAGEMVARWPADTAFAVAPEFQRLTLEVIVRLVFGVEDPARHERLLTVLPALSRAATPVLFSPLLARDLGPRSPGGRFAALQREVDVLVAAEIAEHRRRGDLDERTDVLSVLLTARDEDGRPMTDDELRDELMTLLFAGHETTATALAWAVDLVLHDPKVHARLIAAVDTGDDAYLDAVVQEVHRLRATVPAAVRITKQPFALGRWRLPEGISIAPAIHLLHRRADAYPEPRRFRPERFVGTRPPAYAWLPFGGGVRRCVGAAFAALEMQEVLRTVFRTVALRAADPRPERVLRRTVTAVPRHGTRVVVTGTRRPSPGLVTGAAPL